MSRESMLPPNSSKLRRYLSLRSTFGPFAPSIGLGHQGFSPFHHAGLKRFPIDVTFLSLRQHFIFFFLNVVLDQFSEHCKLGLKFFVAGFEFLELLDQDVDEMMLLHCLIHHAVCFDFLSNGRVDKRFLKVCMDL